MPRPHRHATREQSPCVGRAWEGFSRPGAQALNDPLQGLLQERVRHPLHWGSLTNCLQKGSCCEVWMQELEAGLRQTWTKIPALLLRSRVTLSKSVRLWKPPLKDSSDYPWSSLQDEMTLLRLHIRISWRVYENSPCQGYTLNQVSENPDRAVSHISIL